MERDAMLSRFTEISIHFLMLSNKSAINHRFAGADFRLIVGCRFEISAIDSLF